MAVVSDAEAIKLGEIQVNSHLGQSLKAQAAFVDLGDVNALQLKIRLADVDEYQKLGLQYPDGIKFRFQVVNEQGALAPFIRIITLHPINDPFINLLIEVYSPDSKLFKAYTFLLDPPPDLFESSVTSEPSVSNQQIAAPPQDNETVPGNAAGATPLAVLMTDKPVKPGLKRKKRQHRVVARNGQLQTEAASNAQLRYSKSGMRLAMSLSISKYDSSAPIGTKESSDALHEELIVKEKTLEELKVQIGEMQTVIQALQLKPQFALPVAHPSVKAQPGEWLAINWLNSALTLVILFLASACFVLYRKQVTAWRRCTFDDSSEAPSLSDVPVTVPLQTNDAEISVTTPLQAIRMVEPASVPLQTEEMTLPDSEQSLEILDYTEHEPAVPPEYTLLLKANRYLRAGNDKLAEDALLEAIRIEPKNPNGYLTLLGIYETCGDSNGFEKLKQQLYGFGDETVLNEIAAMSHKPDTHS